MSDIRLYKALRSKLGETEAEELVSFVKSEIENGFMDNKDIFLVKQDKEELIKMIHETRTELIVLIQQTKVDLVTLIYSEKAKLLRAIYIVGLIQFLGIVGAVLAIINFINSR